VQEGAIGADGDDRAFDGDQEAGTAQALTVGVDGAIRVERSRREGQDIPRYLGIGQGDDALSDYLRPVACR
jgi:hypothetical protein